MTFLFSILPWSGHIYLLPYDHSLQPCALSLSDPMFLFFRTSVKQISPWWYSKKSYVSGDAADDGAELRQIDGRFQSEISGRQRAVVSQLAPVKIVPESKGNCKFLGKFFLESQSAFFFLWSGRFGKTWINASFYRNLDNLWGFPKASCTSGFWICKIYIYRLLVFCFCFGSNVKFIKY